MNKTRRYFPEVRERAVRLVFALKREHPSQWASITSIAEKIGCVRRRRSGTGSGGRRDAGRRPGLTTEE